ncbi:MHYT domain-containing protein [Caldimonas sp.]|uniref:MHYT domain-containing protein n=1 Tax=Caldimonas sp. TaxID=2838790 RepID=UPI00307E6A83
MESFDGLGWFLSRSAEVPRAELVYSDMLVAASVIVAMLGGMAAMQLMGIARRPDRVGAATAHAAHWTAVIVLGGSVWSMHFIGMLAVDVCQPVQFDEWVTAASMLPSVVASAVGLRSVQQRRDDLRSIVWAGVVVGAGIGVMHYTGMAAMRMDSQLRYDPTWFAISIVVAVALATLGLGARAVLSRTRWPRLVVALVSGALLGLAISGMHYTAMQASLFVGPVDLLYQRWSSRQFELAVAVALVTVCVFGFAWGVVGLVSYRSLAQHLRERDRLISDILEHLPGTVVRLRARGDETMQRVLVSRSLEDLTGRSLEDYEREQWTLTQIITDADRPVFLQAMRQTLQTGRPIHLNVRFEHASGALRWMEVRAVAHRVDASAPVVDLFLSDVTAAQWAQQREQELLRGVDEVVGRARLSVQGEFLDVNDRLARALEYEPEELIGRPHRSVLLPDQDPAQMEAFWQALRQGQPQKGTFKRRTKSGGVRHLSGWYQPIHDLHGQVVAVLKLVMDVTEHVQALQELQHLNERLQQAMAARSTFFATVSHEIRTPMNAVVGFAELLRDQLTDAEQRAQAQSILDAARSLLRILNDLLDVAKLESGEFSIVEAPFRLPRMLRDLVSQFGVLAARKGLSLRLEMADGLPDGWLGDGDRVRQILTNLLGNALKFTEQGHVTLGAATEDGQLRLWVQDTGIGIDPQRQQAIFEPFVQADAGTARRYGGTGLGMSIVKGLVQRMGGRLSLHSVPGQGTTVTLWLPLAPVQDAPCPTEPSPLPPAAAAQGPRLRVLACDDVEQNRELLRRLLQRAGHEVCVLPDGRSLLQHYVEQGGQWDVILLDLHMPQWDGVETCKQLRAAERAHRWPARPVLALSASVLESDRHAAGQAGMNGFLEKPIDVRALERSVQEHAAQARGEDARASGSDTSTAVADEARGRALWGDDWLARVQDWLREQEPLVRASRWDQWSADQWHRWAGTAANLGLPALAAAARACERALREGRTVPWPQAEQAWRAVWQWCGLSPDADGGVHAGAGTAAHEPGGDVPIDAALLRRLLQACQRGEIDGAALAELAEQDPASAQGLRGWLEEFDFERAAQWLAWRLGDRAQNEEVRA